MPPTTDTCADILLYDEFGDGWGEDIYLEVSQGDVVTQYYLDSCTSSVYSYCQSDWNVTTLLLYVILILLPEISAGHH